MEEAGKETIKQKRASLILIVGFFALLALVTSTSTLSTPSESKSIKPIQIAQSTEERLSLFGFLQLPKELTVREEGKEYAVKFYRWGFILYSKDLAEAIKGNTKEGYLWFSSWKFKFTFAPTKGSSSIGSGSLEYVSFSRPIPESIGEPISGILPPQKYDMYGGFYETAGAHIGVSITWSPADKPIVMSTYCLETGRCRGYILTGGSWTGTLEVLDSGTNFVVVANPNQDVTVTYSGSLLWP
ncbi:MAG: hypothetical protein ACP5IT_12095 [Thermoproteota archaeon]